MNGIENKLNVLIKQFKTINNNNEYKIPNNTVVWFTDGSCINNGKKNSQGAFAAICVSGYTKYNMIYGKMSTTNIKPTNIRAEYYGILSALEKLEYDLKSPKWDKAIIYSDSKFWIDMIYKYMPKWQVDIFDTKKNPDLTKPLWAIWKKLEKSNKSVEIIHVYAHNKNNSKDSTDPFKRFCYNNNNIADELANIAREFSHTKITNTFV